MDLLESAITWVVQGFSVIPIILKDKKPETSLLPGHSWNAFKTRLPTMNEIVTWFSAPRNIALVTGWNNLVVIDFDNMDVFNLWYSLCPFKTYMVKTGRGVHVYVKIIERVNPQHTDFIDIKSAGGYVLIPPSIHPNGYEYLAMNNNLIIQADKLTDVLPEMFLPGKVEFQVASETSKVLDPWAKASNPILYEDDLISKIRANVKIEDFFPKAIQSGDHWMKACCPFHNDSSPSLWIDTKRQICGCHVCSFKPLDVINLYSKLHGVSNREAILSLSGRL